VVRPLIASERFTAGGPPAGPVSGPPAAERLAVGDAH
jgi:hypothetical protein